MEESPSVTKTIGKMALERRCREILEKGNMSTCIAFAVSIRLLLSLTTKLPNNCKDLVYKEQQPNEAEEG